jgi:hypothetical protein
MTEVSSKNELCCFGTIKAWFTWQMISHQSYSAFLPSISFPAKNTFFVLTVSNTYPSESKHQNMTMLPELPGPEKG